MASNELSENEITIIMQVLKSTCSLPICGDKVLFVSNEADKIETSNKIYWGNRKSVFESEKYSKGCLIVPEFMPDQLIPINLSKEALESLVSRIGYLYESMKRGTPGQLLELVYIIKLLILQNSEAGNQGLSPLSADVRN